MGEPYDVRVEWSEDLSFDELGDVEEFAYDFLYAFVSQLGSSPKVIYIGQTYYQYVGDRVAHHHKYLEADRRYKSVTVRIGTIEPLNRERVTKPLVDAVENALICEVAPSLNERSIQYYTQNNDVIITNTGNNDSFPWKIDTREW